MIIGSLPLTPTGLCRTGGNSPFGMLKASTQGQDDLPLTLCATLKEYLSSLSQLHLPTLDVVTAG